MSALDWRRGRGAGCCGSLGMGGRRFVSVAFDAPAPYTDAERNAGFVGTNTAAPRPRSLPRQADFSRTGTAQDSAFWLWRGDLYHGSALQVLRDVRQEMGAGDGPAAWTPGLLQRVQQRAESFNASLGAVDRANIPDLPSEGNELSQEWLQLALWVTYGPGALGGRGTVYNVDLPRVFRTPIVGGDSWPSASGLVAVATSFNPADLSPNPFVPVETFNVEGTVNRPSSRSSSGLGLLLGLVVVGALASSRNS